MRIVVVDDDVLAARSLKTIIEAGGDISVAGTGHSGDEAVRLFDSLRPDLILMDIRMEPTSGLDAGEEILKRHPDAKILFLTTFSDDEYIIRALRLGAKGYILKQDFEHIVPAIRAACAGQSVFGEDVASKIPGLFSRESRADLAACGLTPKEAEIVGLVAEGLSNREIASKLHLSEGTVKNALTVVMDKLGLKSRTQIAVFYYRSSRP